MDSTSLPEAEVFAHLLSRYPALRPVESDIVAAFELLASSFGGAARCSCVATAGARRMPSTSWESS